MPFDESELFDPNFDPDSITDDLIDEIAAVLKSDSKAKTAPHLNQRDDHDGDSDGLDAAPRKRKKAMRAFEDE